MGVEMGRNPYFVWRRRAGKTGQPRLRRKRQGLKEGGRKPERTAVGMNEKRKKESYEQ